MRPQTRRPTHPGKLLYDVYLKPTRITVRQLGCEIDEKPSWMSEFANGCRDLWPGLAEKLAARFSTTTDLWTNLQSNYDRWLDKQPDKKEIRR
jgi:addiction module HigA family antidote